MVHAIGVLLRYLPRSIGSKLFQQRLKVETWLNDVDKSHPAPGNPKLEERQFQTAVALMNNDPSSPTGLFGPKIGAKYVGNERWLAVYAPYPGQTGKEFRRRRRIPRDTRNSEETRPPLWVWPRNVRIIGCRD